MFGNLMRAVQQVPPFCIVYVVVDQFLDPRLLLLNGGCFGIRLGVRSRGFEAPL
jgi:hypothetical protein